MTRKEYENDYFAIEPADLLSEQEMRKLDMLDNEQKYDLPDDLRKKYLASCKWRSAHRDDGISPLEGMLVGDKTVEEVLKEIRAHKK